MNRTFLLATAAIILPLAAHAQTDPYGRGAAGACTPFRGNGGALVPTWCGSLPAMNARPPLATDVAAAGSYWASTRGLYQSLRASPQAWQLVAPPPLPCDALPGAVACYGITRIRAAYGTGPAWDVACGGATYTINFLPSGLPDYATMDADCGAAVPRVSRWYDQSGNGYHATQATAGQQPAVSALNLIGAARDVTFDPVVRGSTTSESLALPAALATNWNSLSVLATVRFGSTSQAAAVLHLGSTGGTAFDLTSLSSGGRTTGTGFASVNTLFGGNGPGVASPVNVAATLSPQVVGVVSNATAWGTIYDDTFQSQGPLSATAMSGGTIGTGIFGAGQEEVAAVVIAPGLSQATVQAAVAAHYQAYGIAPQMPVGIITDGDSRTEGFGAALDRGWARQLDGLLPYPTVVRDVGLFGDLASNRNSNFTGDVGAYYAATAPYQVMVNCAGINDLTQGATDAAVYASLSGWVAKAQALGSNVVPFLCTVPGYQNIAPGVDGYRQALNTRITAGASAGGYTVIDLAADPVVGSTASYANAALSADGVHWTALMASYVAQVAANAISLAVH